MRLWYKLLWFINGIRYGRGDWYKAGAVAPYIVVKSAYNWNSPEYIGDPKTAHFLAKKGIDPQYRKPDSKTCSVGFSHKDNKWYGWSHRAMCGFGVGMTICEESIVGQAVGRAFPIHTLEEARQCAEIFAEEVS